MENNSDHSPKVRRILEQKPSFLVRRGTVVIAVIVILIAALWAMTAR